MLLRLSWLGQTTSLRTAFAICVSVLQFATAELVSLALDIGTDIACAGNIWVEI